MSTANPFMFVLGTVLFVAWIVILRREVRKEYYAGKERGERSRNLVMMGASTTFWLFIAIISSGVDLSWGGK